MNAYQPTLREAQAQQARVMRMLAQSVQTYPVESEEDRHCQDPKTIIADGFDVKIPYGEGRRKRHYHAFVAWPMSRVERRCDDCGAYLRASRDCGGHGFYYDGRWLTGNPAERDPRSEDYDPRSACLACFNRVRQRIRRAIDINEARLMIGRIKREARHAA